LFTDRFCGLKGGIPYGSKEKSKEGSSQKENGSQEKRRRQEKTLTLKSTEER
jgi:hypothetical protein